MLKRIISILVVMCVAMLCACSRPSVDTSLSDHPVQEKHDYARYLSFICEDPDTVDPQCTSNSYTIALNVFDRLMEIKTNDDGSTEIVPSLSDSWEISPDGLTYTFHLHPGVRFSNGEPLTASDVGFTLTRLLTHPKAVNQDIATAIRGAEALHSGRTDTLEGFQLIDDNTFTIELEKPFAAFLACLSTPGASILDETTVLEAGDRFGAEPAWTIGTGPFVFSQWQHGASMRLDANADCWSGPPRCEGLSIRIAPDSEVQRLMFEKGTLDILDLDNLDEDAEYFVHGDIYQELLRKGPRVGITYIALNQSMAPLNDVRVRKALQLSLDRQLLLDAAYSGRGEVENGIFPRGLIGYNPDLEAIPHDTTLACELLQEAGFESGFDLTISMQNSTSRTISQMISLAASMWESIGIRVNIETLNDDAFMAQRKAGQIACYVSTWSADFNDPDNFI